MDIPGQQRLKLFNQWERDRNGNGLVLNIHQDNQSSLLDKCSTRFAPAKSQCGYSIM